jgi:uncharacterized protein (TIGR03435 family)
LVRKLETLASRSLGIASIALIGIAWMQGRASAQIPSARPSFEVASIRPADDSHDPAFLSGTKISGSSVVMRDIGLTGLVHGAFGIEARFLSGMQWLKGAGNFDIRATIPARATALQVPEMIQSLLEERFKLAFHHENRERQIYALLVDKDGAKFQKSAKIDESMPGGGFNGISAVSNDGLDRIWISPNNSTVRITLLPDGGAEWHLIGMSLPELAYLLHDLDGLDIVDMTGLKGLYDFEFASTAEDMNDLSPIQAAQPTGAPSPRQSLQRLGLRLEKRKAMVDILVIDHLEKTPSEN